MSLVPTFVKMANEKWYKNPTLFDETYEWFICFDDDDPPEIVIAKLDRQLSKAIRWDLIEKTLFKFDIVARILSHHECGQRIFPPNHDNFQPAVNAYLSIHQPIDLKNLKIKHDGVFDQMPSEEGVYFDF